MSYGETQELSERLTTRDEPVAICAVACIELADFAKRPVRDQMALMARLNELLAQALAGVAAEDRIVLDAGNGSHRLVWRSVWDSEADAAEFHAALKAYAEARFPGEKNVLTLSGKEVFFERTSFR